MDDGGPAFPVANANVDLPWEGMTLRDYFAAKAMAVALETFSAADAAREAYAYADAMLADFHTCRALGESDTHPPSRGSGATGRTTTSACFMS